MKYLIIVISITYSFTSVSQVNCYDPVWSPDGNQVAFYANPNGDFDVFVVNKDGSDLKKIVVHKGYDGSPAWSPDGSAILFSSKLAGGKTELYNYELATGKLRRITNNDQPDGAPAWSPDGNYIAYETKHEDANEIFVMKADGTETVNITNTKHNDFRPQWSSDGKKIYFQSNRSGKYQIYRMNADGSEVKRVLETDTHVTEPNQINQQQKLVYVNHGEQSGIEILNLETNEVEVVSTEVKDLMLPSFSPDGKSIVFVLIDNGRSDIYIMDYETKSFRPLLKDDAFLKSNGAAQK